MRILKVTQSYAPFFEFGGPPVKVGALARGLAARGHQITVLTADWGLEQRTAGSDASRRDDSPYGWRTTDGGVTAFYLPAWLRYRAVSWSPAVKQFCREQLQNCEVAHIFGLYDFLGPAVAAACVKRNIPYVLEPIGMFVPIVRSFFLKRIYHLIYGQRLFEQAARITATSEQEAEELSHGGVNREKIVLRRNGVEPPRSWPEPGVFRKRLGISNDGRVALFLGRLSQKKSPDLLLRAFAILAREGAFGGLRLVFIGPDEGAMKEHLERMAAELGVSARVQFVGGLFDAEKWAAYRDADVFVLPSQNENFGNTAAEAAAAGTPMVVTEQCGIAPLLANRAGLVVAHEPGQLSEAIRRVLCEPGLHEKLVAGCAEVASRLDWDQPVREMEALYRELAAGASKNEKT